MTRLIVYVRMFSVPALPRSNVRKLYKRGPFVLEVCLILTSESFPFVLPDLHSTTAATFY